LSPSHLLALLDSPHPPVVLDVRSAAEFRGGHVRGARHRPFQRMVAGLPGVDRAQPIVVYCGHGPRAWFAAAMLRLHGFASVSLLDGHIGGWRRLGLPEGRREERAIPRS
jgi:rhodanese-related sulfurtransferase